MLHLLKSKECRGRVPQDTTEDVMGGTDENDDSTTSTPRSTSKEIDVEVDEWLQMMLHDGRSPKVAASSFFCDAAASGDLSLIRKLASKPDFDVDQGDYGLR